MDYINSSCYTVSVLQSQLYATRLIVATGNSCKRSITALGVDQYTMQIVVSSVFEHRTIHWCVQGARNCWLSTCKNTFSS